jgi:hypothetical protein
VLSQWTEVGPEETFLSESFIGNQGKNSHQLGCRLEIGLELALLANEKGAGFDPKPLFLLMVIPGGIEPPLPA